MNVVTEATERYSSWLQSQFDRQAPGTQALAKEMQVADSPLVQIRKEARESFERLGFPDRKQEEWRYTNIDSLLEHSFESDKTGFLEVEQLDQVIDEIPGLDAFRIVFMDNRVLPQFSRLNNLPSGVSIRSLKDIWSTNKNDSETMQHPDVLAQQWFASTRRHTDNTFVALNTAMMTDGLFIHVEKGTVFDKPIEVVYRATSHENQVTSTPRVLVMLEEGAQITLIERFYGTGEATYFQNVVQDIVLAPMAHVTHYRLLQEHSQAFHLSNIVVQQKQNSHYHATNFDLTGALLRTNIEIDFQGQNAECDLKGLYIVNDNQQTDIHTNILHHVPSCHSQQFYKGVLPGKGRAVFDGRIFVDKDAQNTDAQLSNNNLLLCEGAEVDTKPQLEIYADNVKCSHGTTVGQLEPEQLFYLRSRGIAEADAFRMLCRGFTAEILLDCDIESLREYVDNAMQKALTLPSSSDE